jgi:hypothetical protein
LRIKFIVSCLAFIACCSLCARAQQTAGEKQAQAQVQTQAQTQAAERRVPLAEPAVAFDAMGREALAGHLLTMTLNGSNDAPVRNVRLAIESRSADFYTYISGWATFYNDAGVRCGEGMFKLDALASQETAEVDTPGMRLTCSPFTWRIVALNLLTRVGDTARPIIPTQQDQPNSTAAGQPQQANAQQVTNAQRGANEQPVAANALPLFVNLSVDGHAYRVPLGSTLEIPVNKKRTKITVSASPQ